MLKMLYDALPHFADVLAAFLVQLITLKDGFQNFHLAVIFDKKLGTAVFKKIASWVREPK